MKVIYAQEPTHVGPEKSIFLVGPTPRSPEVQSWRPEMIAELEKAGFDGVIYSPEPRENKWQGDYLHQVEWEIKHLDLCDLIIAWVARKLPEMPAFTTNVEFGRYVGSGKLLYGRPFWAEKIRYLDWLYRQVTNKNPTTSMEAISLTAVDLLSKQTHNESSKAPYPFVQG